MLTITPHRACKASLRGFCRRRIEPSLTLTDFHSGWTELAALWGNSGGEVRAGPERVEKRLPFPVLGYDCANGSGFLNEIVEAYLLRRHRSVE